MKNKILHNVFLYIFILFSLIVIVYGVLFVISQMISIKYYFDDCLSNGNNSSVPICQKEFFLELVLYAKILVFYAIYGLILAICCIRKKQIQ
jgi:hypothetical protein